MPTLLITGANRGIGLELCKQYLNLGWQVHATCRNPQQANELNDLTKTYSSLLYIHSLDVSKELQIKELKSKLGNLTIDVLFNNAGVYGGDSSAFGNTDTKVWLDTFNINVISPMKMIEAFVNNVASSEIKIIANMSSKMGSLADNKSSGSFAYRSSKAALNSVVVTATHDLTDLGITVLALHPGWVRTDMGGPNGELSVEESATSLRKNIDNSSIKDTGSFLDIDGTTIPW